MVLIPKNLIGPVACLSYALISISLVIFNKAVFFRFSHPIILLIYQTAFGVFASVCIGSAKNFKLTTAVLVVPTSLFFVGMALSGMTSLKYVNIPMYSALRKLTTVVVMIGEAIVLHTRFSFGVVFCVIVMSAGAVLAGFHDLHASSLGYFLVLLCCVLTAGYTISMKRVMNVIEEKTGSRLSVREMLFYNLLNSLPLLLVVSASQGTLSELLIPLDASLLLFFVPSSLLAFLLNYTTFWCTEVNSPLTTSIVGDIKNVICDILGVILFPDVTITAGYGAGILVSTGGGLAYSYVKQKEMRKKQQQAELEAAENLGGENRKDIEMGGGGGGGDRS